MCCSKNYVDETFQKEFNAAGHAEKHFDSILVRTKTEEGFHSNFNKQIHVIFNVSEVLQETNSYTVTYILILT